MDKIWAEIADFELRGHTFTSTLCPPEPFSDNPAAIAAPEPSTVDVLSDEAV